MLLYCGGQEGKKHLLKLSQLRDNGDSATEVSIYAPGTVSLWECRRSDVQGAPDQWIWRVKIALGNRPCSLAEQRLTLQEVVALLRARLRVWQRLGGPVTSTCVVMV